MKAPLQGLGQMESTPDRVLPPLNRGSLRLSNPNSNIFSDEFALQPFELTGRHHTTLPDRGEDHDVAPNPSPQISLPSRQSSSRASTITRSPPSISGSIQRNRLSQRSQRSDASNSVSSSFNDHAAQTSPPPRSVTSVSDVGNASMAGGSSRTTSTFGYPRAQSPYQGATGPSHTYGMYPQDIGVMRTPSTVTISTIRRPERSYSGPSGPTQPYGMYPQNTVPEIDQVSIAGNVPPVAGFPGLGQAYQRRLGPEGEDVDDLVGPDGYAEQLPPYTRFPNGVPPQYSSGIGSLRRSGILAPLEDSQETLNSPREVASPANPFGDSAAQLNPAPSVAVPPKEECGGFKERVREKSKRKVCGGVLPCWVLCIISVVVILAVILGGAIGGMIAHKHTSRWTDHLQPEAAHTVTASRAPG